MKKAIENQSFWNSGIGSSSFREEDNKSGKALLKSGHVLDVLFSEGTYQIEVKEGKKIFWPFLQLDDKGKVIDRFCTCEKAEKVGSCKHLAAAFLQIFSDGKTPLHVRFRSSLWNHLCLLAARRHGYEAENLKRGHDSFFVESHKGKKLFEIIAQNEEGRKLLKNILLERKIETEETSLKFSNLPPDELALWKEGRPSHHLSYELSFWSDLAKTLFLKQERGENYKIEFVPFTEEVPKEIRIAFSSLKLSFYIAAINWPEIIPSLASVKSPLQVFPLQEQVIQKLTYDPSSSAFYLESTPLLLPFQEEVDWKKYPHLGDWVYVPKKGFFLTLFDPLLKENKIVEEKISLFFQKHLSLIEKTLVKTRLHLDPVKAQYTLAFDDMKNLKISCFIFEPNDLKKGNSHYFGPWAYLDPQGFFKLENLLFDGIELTIARSQVSDFVTYHRRWLADIKGFQTHLSTLPPTYKYFLDENKNLSFEIFFEEKEEGKEVIDFEDWIYLEGLGFYPKSRARSPLFSATHLKIERDKVGTFLSQHLEELEQIPGFFTTYSPIEKSGLKVELDEKERIVIEPVYLFKKTKRRPIFFGNYLYLENEGFSEVPDEFKLPEKYQQKSVIEKDQEPYFLAYELEHLKPRILVLDPRLKPAENLLLKIENIEKDEKMWDVNLAYETLQGKVPLIEIWTALQEKKNFLFSRAGLLFLRDSRYYWLKTLNKSRFIDGKIRLSTVEWLRLFAFENVHLPTPETKEGRESLKIIETFNSFETDEALDLKGLKSDLRPYQKVGVKWLWFLYCSGLSGILCDEMGLGKTHQAMALLAAIRNSQEERLKALVVCPTSVIYHWEELLHRFLPSLKVFLFYGAKRLLQDFRADFDLLLTSYGTLRSDRKLLGQIPFKVAIFDEAQVAKNLHSQTHHALKTINADMRLALSGTPIENRLLELKSLFDIVLPGYLPGETLFREIFVTPIEKFQDTEKKMQLTRLIKPFILRRRKTEVLQDLPEKTEEVSYCDLSEEQHALYKKAYLASKEILVKEIEDEKKPLPFIHIFALFSTLKQICDHPALFHKAPQNYQRYRSGKWELFIELLAEARGSGQKVVVFSQYLDMLTIIESYLDEHKIGWAEIRGSTRNRKEPVERFKNDPHCEVFVASLQAAGVGIDLVSASVVIHYDRWWNPAKENQATDRVHRIGQNRGVQVFKLVTKHTIEEHIHRLIEKKSELLRDIIGYDDQAQVKLLTRNELMTLFQLLNQDIR